MPEENSIFMKTSSRALGIKKSISMARKGWIANLRMKAPVSFWLTTVWKAKSLP